MNRTGFINQLAEHANITSEQAAQVEAILEVHHIVGKNSKLTVIAEIKEKLGIDEEAAKEISDTASALIAGNIKHKILHPFGSDLA